MLVTSMVPKYWKNYLIVELALQLEQDLTMPTLTTWQMSNGLTEVVHQHPYLSGG